MPNFDWSAVDISSMSTYDVVDFLTAGHVCLPVSLLLMIALSILLFTSASYHAFPRACSLQEPRSPYARVFRSGNLSTIGVRMHTCHDSPQSVTAELSHCGI